MKTFLLDTSALLTLRDGEPGADEVAALLQQAAAGSSQPPWLLYLLNLAARAAEPTLSNEAFLAQIKADGALVRAGLRNLLAG